MAPRARNGQRQVPPDEDEDGTAGFSDDQRNEINELVNAAFTSHVKRKLPGIVQGALERPLGEIRALIENGAGRSGRQPEPDLEDEEGEPDEQPAQRRAAVGRGAVPTRQAARDRGRGDREERGSRGTDPELAKLQSKMAKLEAERAAEQQAARNSERDGMLRELLGAAGVDKNRIRGAVAVLRDSMRYDDKAREWAFVARRDGFDEDVDPDAGVKEWAATDEGKSYLAPPGAGGAGAANAGTAGVTRRSGAGTRMSSGPRGSTAPAADPRAARSQAVAQAQQTLSTAIDSLSGGAIPLG